MCAKECIVWGTEVRAGGWRAATASSSGLGGPAGWARCRLLQPVAPEQLTPVTAFLPGLEREGISVHA